MNLRATIRRTAVATAAVTAALALSAGPASAHHCYKNAWQQSAHQHHLAGGTAWVPLSDLGAMYLVGPDYSHCHWVADDVVADFMAERNLVQEPMIHSRATTGSGAAYQGKTVKPFSYLSEADFGQLSLAIAEQMAVCDPGWTMPAMG